MLVLASLVLSAVAMIPLCIDKRAPLTMRYDEYDGELVWGAMIDLDKGYDWIRGIMEDLGLRTARVSAYWDLTEPIEGGGYDWTVTHRSIESALRWGLEPVVLIIGTPKWASGVTKSDEDFLSDMGLGHLSGVVEPTEASLERYRKWLRVLARHFKGKVKYYEFWNEPDGMGWPIIERGKSGSPTGVRWGGNPRLYSQYLSVTYDTVKSVDPEAQVAVGGLESNTSFLKSLYATTSGACFDAVCIHPYGGGEDMGHGPPGQALDYEWIAEIRCLMLANGDGEKAIWVTEYGWRTDPGDETRFRDKIRYLQEALEFLSETSWITIANIHYLSGHTEDPWDSSHRDIREAWRAVRWA